MKIELIDYTGIGFPDPALFAMAKLAITKRTRLEMNFNSRVEVNNMVRDELFKEIEYMANTIPSSWEFVDYTFAVEGISIACARQIMRTRHASFAQQSLRIVDVSDGFEYRNPFRDEDGRNLVYDESGRERVYDEAMGSIEFYYTELIKEGAKPEDARGILPLNMHTNFIMKIDLRNFVDLVRKRSSPRVQSEYREVIALAKAEVLRVHPFVSLFLSRTFDKAAEELSEEISSLTADSPDVGSAQVLRMQKLLDIMRTA